MKICVYCGSSNGFDKVYSDAARQLGEALVKAGYGLVYGGAGIGLMGQVADSVLTAGGLAIGVIPSIFADRLSHPDLTTIYVVETMHERKKKMFDLSDGFIALPGGFGTLEELAEMVTWSQIGINRKPCGILNVNGFYDPFIEFIDNMVSNGFSRQEHREMLMVDDCPRKLLSRFQDYKVPVIGKWI